MKRCILRTGHFLQRLFIETTLPPMLGECGKSETDAQREPDYFIASAVYNERLNLNAELSKGEIDVCF